MSESQVRLIVASDVNDLIHLVKESHEEEPTIPLPFDAGSVFSAILRALRGEAVIGLISNDNEIESACFLEVTRPWYADTSILQSLFCWTRAPYRKSTNSKALLSWARHQAECLNVPLQMEVPLTEPNKPRFALCERILGAPAGMSFLHTPHPDKPEDLSETNVQPACPNDEPQVFDVIRELASENGAYIPNEAQAIPLLRAALHGHGVIGIIRQEKDIEGLIFLTVANVWFSREPFLDEYFLFIRPQYRKSSNAKALIQFAKRQADRLDLSLRIGIISKIELSRKLALYERLLGSPATAHFSYRP